MKIFAFTINKKTLCILEAPTYEAAFEALKTWDCIHDGDNLQVASCPANLILKLDVNIITTS